MTWWRRWVAVLDEREAAHSLAVCRIVVGVSIGVQLGAIPRIADVHRGDVLSPTGSATSEEILGNTAGAAVNGIRSCCPRWRLIAGGRRSTPQEKNQYESDAPALSQVQRFDR